MKSSKKHAAVSKSSSLAIVETNPDDKNVVVPIEAPIVSSYNDRIRPLLDTVDRLRNLNVMKEGIQLPTIVVVGDQNRVGEETYQEARMQEELLFRTHPMLSLIDEDIVGIPVLAQKLMHIQATMIARCLPEIVRKINMKMENAVLELNKLPMVMASTGEALMTLMDIITSAKESLLKILIQGDFSEFPDEPKMHSTARLAEMLSHFSDNLQETPKEVTEFLMDEIKILDECKCVGLPNFIPRSAFLAILSEHVDVIHMKPVEFIRKIWDYIEGVLISVLSKYSENFPQIQSSIKRAGRSLITKTKEQAVNRVSEMVEMEKLTDYTCNPDYMKTWTEKTASQQNFIHAVLDDEEYPENFSLTGFGVVKISHLREYHAHLLQQAFDMKMRITSYWTIVLGRIVDNLALYLQFSVKNLVNAQFQEIVAEMVDPRGGGGVERMMEESPSVASKREKLKKSVKLLKESKDVVAAIADQTSGFGDR
ncbi:hypothetical protein YC2023_106591 [Brassica napus]